MNARFQIGTRVTMTADAIKLGLDGPKQRRDGVVLEIRQGFLLVGVETSPQFMRRQLYHSKFWEPQTKLRGVA